MASSLVPRISLSPCARKTAALAAGFAMTAATAGCAPKRCTEMGCADSFSVTAATADKSWAAGEYTLELTVDGAAVSCAYSWTNTPQAGGSGVFVQCSPTVTVAIEAVTTCTETVGRNAVSQSCTPVPGQFRQLLTVRGTPARVDVVARRNGALFGERRFTPKYQTSYPNGKDCAPACRGDAQDWELP
ncbi:hypothetical protein [Sorangium sp. So ce1000]|uniref:hypothetical protein n=1 Tax=Sorangium sp. So ce1000 TaxID=3133325 RepID=UPI003F5DFEE5